MARLDSVRKIVFFSPSAKISGKLHKNKLNYFTSLYPISFITLEVDAVLLNLFRLLIATVFRD